jgi:hypothetical protein
MVRGRNIYRRPGSLLRHLAASFVIVPPTTMTTANHNGADGAVSPADLIAAIDCYRGRLLRADMTVADAERSVASAVQHFRIAVRERDRIAASPALQRRWSTRLAHESRDVERSRRVLDDVVEQCHTAVRERNRIARHLAHLIDWQAELSDE